MSAIELSILIPAYKEAGRIGASLDELASYLKHVKQTVEVIIIDRGSPDDTEKEAFSRAKKFKNFRYIDLGHQPPGQSFKGKQVRAGIFEAKGRYILFMDADLATPLKYLDDVFLAMKHQVPVAICVRNLNESHRGLRKFISGFGNFLVQMLLLPGIRDSQCGFKAFNREAARHIFGRQKILGWGFDMEVLAIARKLGYGIEVIDVPDWTDVKEGSKLSGKDGAAFKAALQVFIDLLKIKWGMLTGRYKNVSYHHQPTTE